MFGPLLLGLLLGTPPSPAPDPHAILSAAQSDARAGRHAEALEKFLWFHANALTHDPALAGVRLSFALGYWSELAEDYPPARRAMEKVRADTERKLSPPGPVSFEAFMDVAALNRALEDEARTAQAFRALESRDPKGAAMLFDIARDALILEKDYATCARYVNAEADWAEIRGMWEMDQAFAARDAQDPAEMRDYARRAFRDKVATLVALLTVTDRRAQAAKVAEEARVHHEDPELDVALDRALEGGFPAP